jgi:hypothetical protein
MIQGILINLLQESIAQCIIDLIKSIDHPVGDVFM